MKPVSGSKDTRYLEWNTYSVYSAAASLSEIDSCTVMGGRAIQSSPLPSSGRTKYSLMMVPGSQMTTAFSLSG